MNRNRIEDFGPYQDALQLFDGVVEDMAILQKDPRCYRLIGQQIGSADSICANIDEGFGRIISRLTRTIQTLKANNPPTTRSPLHPTPDTRHPTLAPRHPTPDTRPPTLAPRHPTPDTRPPTPDTETPHD